VGRAAKAATVGLGARVAATADLGASATAVATRARRLSLLRRF
jgi:hypothetical protein